MCVSPLSHRVKGSTRKCRGIRTQCSQWSNSAKEAWTWGATSNMCSCWIFIKAWSDNHILILCWACQVLAWRYHEPPSSCESLRSMTNIWICGGHWVLNALQEGGCRPDSRGCSVFSWRHFRPDLAPTTRFQHHNVNGDPYKLISDATMPFQCNT